jgi:hypothetical protein
MIITPPISGKGGRKSQPVEDTIYRDLAGVAVIVVVGAVYNGPDHKNLNNGKECQPGDRITISQANAQWLLDHGMVRLPTPEDDRPVQAQDQVLLEAIKVGLVEASKAAQAKLDAIENESAAEPLVEPEAWLDWTPIMDAGVPESIARGLYEQGYTSKAKMIEAYNKRGEDALLVVVGMGPSRVRKVLNWLGIE